jgi:hypothetical protein
MKKLIYGTLFLALVGIGVVGCKKEVSSLNTTSENVSSPYKGVTIANNMLTFETNEDYFKIVNDSSYKVREDFTLFLKTLNFKNYFSASQKKSEGSQEMDEFFGQILNQNGCIQIGENVFKIDLLKERVFVMKNSMLNEYYSDLINGNLQVENILEFQLTDDIFTILEGGVGEKCPSPDGFELESMVQDNNTFRTKCFLRLFAAGIYYRVTGRSEMLGSFSGAINLKLNVKVKTAEIRRRPCSNGDVTYHSIGIKQNISYTKKPNPWEAYSKAWNVKSMKIYFNTDAIYYADNTLYASTPNVGIEF